MKIGIDASRAFVKERTGIEEYSYQVIKHLPHRQAGLRDEPRSHQVILYLREGQEKNIDFELPENWKVKVIKGPYLWTQIGLSLEMLVHPVDVLFIPAHTVPVIHAKNTVVTIHGLEYEFCPSAYSFWEKLYMRCVIRNSCRWAKKIIAVSENTKRDLMKLYKVPEEKIEVIYEGYDSNVSFRAERSEVEESSPKNLSRSLGYARDDNKRYLLFIGRLEERKNIIGIIKTFEILKEQYKLPHKLVLAGKFGYGEDKIREELRGNNFANDIILTGYVIVEEKWNLLKNADVFLFPTFYEGFGLPILEAQSAGVPVVAGNNSSIKEITTNYEFYETTNCHDCHSVILVDPHSAEQIADAAYKLISDKVLRGDIIKKGYENVKRFSWEKCAAAVADVIQIRE